MDKLKFNNRMFYNSDMVFVEYFDLIRQPQYALILMNRFNTALEELCDFSDIKNFSEFSLFEWYVYRMHQNVYEEVLRPGISEVLPEKYLDGLVQTQLKSDPMFIHISPKLKLVSALQSLIAQEMAKKIVIYTEEENDYIRDDIRQLFGDHNVEYWFGSFSSVLPRIPIDTTFFLSDINKVQMLIDKNRIKLTSIILPMEYRYNKIDMNTFSIDVIKLSEKLTFKIAFFSSCSDVDFHNDETMESILKDSKETITITKEDLASVGIVDSDEDDDEEESPNPIYDDGLGFG